MNAQEARKITEKNLTGPVIEPYLNSIYKSINEAAKEGRNIICSLHYLGDLYKIGHWATVEKAVYDKLRSEGYKVTDYPDPDPGHPCSCPYTEISW